MNSKANYGINQEVNEGIAKKTRAQYRREEKADRKKVNAGFKVVGSVLSDEEIERRKQSILTDLKSRTWWDLETKGKFNKNDKLSFINDEMLIVGCDVGSEKHYIRAIDARGRELAKKALGFDNDLNGFEEARDWMLKIAVSFDKKQIVMGLEPTGHYWLVRPYRVILNY